MSCFGTSPEDKFRSGQVDDYLDLLVEAIPVIAYSNRLEEVSDFDDHILVVEEDEFLMMLNDSPSVAFGAWLSPETFEQLNQSIGIC